MSTALASATPASRPVAGTPARTASRAITLTGRILFSGIFLLAGPNHFQPASIQYAAHAGVPFPGLLVPASGVLALIGALSVAIGYRARAGAWLIVLFLVPVTLSMHAFWSVTDPMMQQMQMAMFMKNLSILGGALLITQTGAGPLSVDAARRTT